MDWQQRCIRFCASLLACAVVLRLGDRGWIRSAAMLLEKPSVASFLTYLQTGRVVRMPPETQAVTEHPVKPT